MSEQYEKIDENNLKIISQTQTETNKTYEELKAELAQAELALENMKKSHADMEAQVQTTIDLMTARVTEADKLDIKEIIKVNE